MMRRVLPVAFLLCILAVPIFFSNTSAQVSQDQAPPPADQPDAPTSPAHSSESADRTDQLQHADQKHGLTDTLTDLLSELRGAVRVFPESVENRLKLADALYRVGDLEASIEECRVATRLQPDSAQAHVQLGTALMAKQEWRTSLAELKEAIRLKPDLVQAHYNLGATYYSLGNPKAAIDAYREALHLQPNFPDASYHLGLVLKLANREKEAAEQLEEAARGGIAKAQYFLGNAYRSGQGVEKSLVLAITWWVRAAEHGVTQAIEALAQVRQASLKGSRNKDAQAAALGLRDYRNSLWQGFPDLMRTDEAESVGAALVKAGRAQDAVPVLIREAYASPETAQPLLETVYEHGVENQLPPFDLRILRFFETTAAAGLPGSRVMLAQIYARGLGVPPDAEKARTLLKGFSKGRGSQTKKD